jgi:hypothetical protein
MTVLGSGQHRYRVVENWAKLPDGWNLTDVGAVAVDSKDRIYVFNRGEHPMVVLNRDGSFIKSWGEGLFTRAHGLHIDADDNLYCTDDGDHTVRKCTDRRQGAAHHRHSGTARAVHERRAVPPLHPHGAVAEGRDLCLGRLRQCLRAQVHAGRQAADVWGEPGTDPGQFNIVHNIVTDADGWVYVADRENHRVQVFDGNGKYETQWNNLHRPCALCCCGGKTPNFIVGELGPACR